ncbi:ATPase [Patescibacteria group bacterium]|nr:MAG: ATPase [Patescibacteria group bacterium]
MEQKKIFITKTNGKQEEFDVHKVAYSLKKVGASDRSVDKVIEHLQSAVHDGMSTHDIYKEAFSMLHAEEKVPALRYSLRRSIMDLGPSGFPFEKFLGEIFKKEGFSILTDQIVKGRCVEHEVDVVAYDKEKLIMAEVKFHNELGVKSDLKVALYVKARMDDLKHSSFNYGGKERKLDEGWLITNTKFSAPAIQYAECEGLKMIGWNYPVGAGLETIIEKSALHPVTVLTTLSQGHKKQLMDSGTVLCGSVRHDKSLLKPLGLSDAEIQSVVDETQLLCPVE